MRSGLAPFGWQNYYKSFLIVLPAPSLYLQSNLHSAARVMLQNWQPCHVTPLLTALQGLLILLRKKSQSITKPCIIWPCSLSLSDFLSCYSSSCSIHPSHSVLLAISSAFQACVHLRDFALVVPSVYKALTQHIFMAHSSPLSDLYSNPPYTHSLALFYFRAFIIYKYYATNFTYFVTH